MSISSKTQSAIIAAEESLKELFKSHFGDSVHAVTPVKADASDRKLFRLTSRSQSAIGVIYSDFKENRAFLEFSRHFRQAGLPVPQIYAEDLGKGIYLQEDLGDITLFSFLSQNRSGDQIPEKVLAIYRQAAERLAQFQIVGGKKFPYEYCYPRADFDKQSMMWDLNYFKYYFLRLAKMPFDEQALEDDFERFADFLLGADCDFFLYRDFQSRNIMIREGAAYFIDYQGGRKGALQYDIASLLFDAKADLPWRIREEILDHYLGAVSKLVRIKRTEFMKRYYGYVFIRIMQAMGTYGLRGFYEGKSHFLQSIPYAVRNLEVLLRSVELPVPLPALLQVFKRLVGSSYLRQFGGVSLKLTVRIQSFSYAKGVPMDEKGHGGGYVFDCRALSNPGKYESYASFTGLDKEVAAFLGKDSAVAAFMTSIYSLIDRSVENYQSRNFTDLMVLFGCTGGQHRSVYCAELLAKHLRQKYKVQVELRHRELEKSGQ